MNKHVKGWGIIPAGLHTSYAPVLPPEIKKDIPICPLCKNEVYEGREECVHIDKYDVFSGQLTKVEVWHKFCRDKMTAEMLMDEHRDTESTKPVEERDK